MKTWAWIVCGVLSVLVAASVWAEGPRKDMEIPSSPNPVGSGARAIGMGGSFIAIADDATAASWNPAGLYQLQEIQFSVVGGYVNRSEDNRFVDYPDASGSQSVSTGNLNYLSVAFPFEGFGKFMNLSLNYQHLYDFNRKWSFLIPDEGINGDIDYQYEQDGDLYALGLAYSVNLHPDVSVGFTLNYWGDFLFENKWEQTYHQTYEINTRGVTGTAGFDKKDEYQFSGWNANVGFLWQISRTWRVGGVFKSPFTADVDHSVTMSDYTQFDPYPDDNTSHSRTHDYEEKLDMPMSYGAALAYFFNDEWWVSLDVYYTRWEDFELEDETGRRISPISGKEIGESKLESAPWWRIGSEYTFNDVSMPWGMTAISVRGGLFYDPAPAEGGTDDFYGCALGTGMAYKGLKVDLSWQYRQGKEVGGTFLQGVDMKQDVEEHKVYGSVVYRFGE